MIKSECSVEFNDSLNVDCNIVEDEKGLRVDWPAFEAPLNHPRPSPGLRSPVPAESQERAVVKFRRTLDDVGHVPAAPPERGRWEISLYVDGNRKSRVVNRLEQRQHENRVAESGRETNH